MDFEDKEHLKREAMKQTFTMEGEVGVDTKMYFTEKGWTEFNDFLRRNGCEIAKRK